MSLFVLCIELAHKQFFKGRYILGSKVTPSIFICDYVIPSRGKSAVSGGCVCGIGYAGAGTRFGTR